MCLLQLMQQSPSLNKPHHAIYDTTQSPELLSWTVKVARHDKGAEALSKANTDKPDA